MGKTNLTLFGPGIEDRCYIHKNDTFHVEVYIGEYSEDKSLSGIDYQYLHPVLYYRACF